MPPYIPVNQAIYILLGKSVRIIPPSYGANTSQKNSAVVRVLTRQK